MLAVLAGGVQPGWLRTLKFKAFVYVTLKVGYSDPEGETTAHALRGLGYDVVDVRSSKAYEVSYEARDRSEAERLVDEMCRRLLTNPTKDDYRFEIREMR
ncbi:phosphoribosylformylglycinamidine synthase subunit PurS [Candidatus Bathyarchaeota archaeon]|nr:phosphoribosylformylglycinamidine synthase subunit PurS [Candidatus Bathyarchaeota archaeon]